MHHAQAIKERGTPFSSLVVCHRTQSEIQIPVATYPGRGAEAEHVSGFSD
jgi:hypothetical protein